MSGKKSSSGRFFLIVAVVLLLYLVGYVSVWIDAHPGFSVSDVAKVFYTSTPVPTPLPSPTLPPVQEVTVPAVRVPGWKDAAINAICLEVEENLLYGVQTAFIRPIDDVTRQILEGMGLEVMGKGEACDATLSLYVEVQALSAEYGVLGTCFTGASVDGQLVLKAPRYPETIHRFGGRRDPLPVIQRIGSVRKCSSPEDVHIYGLWEESYLDGLFSFWGPAIIVQASRSEHEHIVDTARILVREALGIEDYQSTPDEATHIVAELRENRKNLITLMVRDGGLPLEDFGKLGPEAKIAVPYLISYLVESTNSDNVKYRKQLVSTLGQIGPDAKKAIPYFVEILRNIELATSQDDAAIGFWRHTVAVLGLFGSDAIEAVPYLIAVLDDKTISAHERQEARRALEAITGQPLGMDAGDWRKWWEKQPISVPNNS